MGWIDHERAIYSCDRCKETFDDNGKEGDERFYLEREIVQEFFKGRPHPLMDKELCLSCLKEVLPMFPKLRDVDETIVYVNYLLRSIRAVRNKDYWPNENDAGKGGIERLKRNIRDRASISAPQAL